MTPKPQPANSQKAPLKGGLGGDTSGPLIPQVVVPAVAEIDQRTPGKDLRLVHKAVRQRWEIPDLAMTALPNAMLRMAMDPQREDRARVNAARVVVTMHGQNEPDIPQSQQNNLQVNVMTGISHTVEQLLQAPGYLEYLERDTNGPAENCDAGTVRGNGVNGEVPEAVAHPSDLNGHHANGNGHALQNGHSNGPSSGHSNGHAAH